MNRVDEAISLFKEGFNCSQSIFAVFGTSLGIERDTVLKISSAFGGGIGMMGETCGVVTGALMVIGLKYGAVSANDKEAKAKTYELANTFVSNFKARNNSVKCGDLLGFDIRSRPDSRKIISKQCSKYVLDAVTIIEEMLNFEDSRGRACLTADRDSRIPVKLEIKSPKAKH